MSTRDHQAVLAAADERLALLAQALNRPAPEPLAAPTWAALGHAAHELVDPRDRSQVWLALTVLSGCLPSEQVVEAVAMASEFDTGRSLGHAIRKGAAGAPGIRDVVIATPDMVLVDIATTLASPWLTGIQRVVRETTVRWLGYSGFTPVSWTPLGTACRLLTEAEMELLRTREAISLDARPRPNARHTLVVPWECTYVLSEVIGDAPRSAAVSAIGRYSRCRTAAIGYDTVVITSGETRVGHDSETFLKYLAALEGFDHIAAISGAAKTEFSGWKSALKAIGRTGPSLDTVPLPVAIDRADAEVRETVRVQLPDLPMVLVVGSHEPRKNHMAVLHAAELLWRAGHEFALCFAGGRSWGSDAFERRVKALMGQGREIHVFRAVDDDFLAAAYELARFTVFPSLNEGFGLPVGESLALGTPVITSNFGSMAEIAADGGALLVDPRDDHALRDAMEALLTDELLLTQLEDEARSRPARGWDDYAKETWQVLVDGSRDA